MAKILSVPGFTEPVSSWSHLLGAAVFFALAVRLLRTRCRGPERIAAVVTYGLSAVFLLSMSGVYHLLEADTPARAVLRQLDHAAIFGLIAGNLTAVHMILFKGPWRWGMITVAWTACVMGVTLKLVFFAQTPEWLGLAVYLGMGWLGLITTIKLWREHGLKFVSLLIAGGLTYTAGAVLEFLRTPVLIPGVIGPHELFHFAVVLALGLHWRFFEGVLASQDAQRASLS